MDTANTIAVALNLLLYCIHVALVMNTMIIALCLHISLFVYIVLTTNDNTIHTTKQQTLYYVLLVVTIICFHCVAGDVLPNNFTCQVWKHIMTSPGSASTYMHILEQRHSVLTLCGSENLYQKVMECEGIFMVHGICLWYIFSPDMFPAPRRFCLWMRFVAKGHQVPNFCAL